MKELIELATPVDGRPNPKLQELSSYDAMIIVHLAGTFSGKERGRERDRLLNRIEGTPIQTINLNNKDNKPTEADINKISDAEAVRLYEESIRG